MDVTEIFSKLVSQAGATEFITYGFYSVGCWLIKEHLNTLKKLQRDVAKVHEMLAEHSQWQTFVEHRLDKLEHRR